jgi:hypothetical protein
VKLYKPRLFSRIICLCSFSFFSKGRGNSTKTQKTRGLDSPVKVGETPLESYIKLVAKRAVELTSSVHGRLRLMPCLMLEREVSSIHQEAVFDPWDRSGTYNRLS